MYYKKYIVSTVFVIQKVIMTNQKKIGRPRLSKEKARSSTITLRLQEDELKKIQAASLKEGLSQSDWLRKVLAKGIECV